MKTNQYILLILSALSFVACNDTEGVPFGDGYTDEALEYNWVLDVSVSDEFDNWNNSKWGTSLWYDVTSDFAFTSDNVYVKDGLLHLAAKKESYNGKEYTCGAVISTTQLGNNTCVEIRAKTIDYRANVTTALWLSDQPAVENDPNVEIDIMETLQAKNAPQNFTATVHYWENGQDTALGWVSIDMPTGNLSDDFHVYKLIRLDNYIKMYIDDIAYWEFNTTNYQNVSYQDRYIILSVEGHAGAPVDEFLPSEFLIDYVRVFRTTNSN